MPKKFATENPKAAAARERKKVSKEAEQSKKQQRDEEEYWKDDDKSIKKKQQRKEEADRKKEEQLIKKAEKKQLLEEEMSQLKSGKIQPPSKVTRAQISHNATASTAIQKKDLEKKVVTHLDTPLEENFNRLQIDGEEARSVTDAITILGDKTDDLDKHPEKRMKAAYNAFEERRLQELKAENSHLRLSQLKQMIFKEWQKSPENPLNQ